jgi:hypothetical protein
MPTKEAIYDDEVSPLMAQVIAICKRANIPVHASFQLDEDLACTTHVAPEKVEPEDADGFAEWTRKYGPLARIASRPSSPLMITTRDGSGKITSVEAIL